MKPLGCGLSASAVLALLLSCELFGFNSPAQAQSAPIVVVARSISSVPMLHIGAFAEKYGLKTEIMPFATNAEMQNGLRTGSAELGQLGQQSPAILADQGASDVKVVVGYVTGAHNLIVRKAAGINSWKDLRERPSGERREPTPASSSLLPHRKTKWISPRSSWSTRRP